MTQTEPRADARTHSAGQTIAVDPATMTVRAVITTNGPDRAGDVVVPAGLRNAAEFLRNPVVLWAHQRTLPPIGICTALEVEGDRIVAETKFSESSPFARDVFKLYAEGILRGWSIGFVPAEAITLPPTRDRPSGGTRYPAWDLLEYSAVPIPENPRALTLAVRKGLIQDVDLRQWLIRDVLATLIA